MLILAGASSRAHVALCTPGLLQKAPFESVFSSAALFSELIRTRDQRAGQAATLGSFHQFITHVTLSALCRKGGGGQFGLPRLHHSTSSLVLPFWFHSATFSLSQRVWSVRVTKDGDIAEISRVMGEA